ncbi:ArsR/SmtB family transcription factor [Streptomyces liliifuscus]|uniref:Winged helix-turn-helix transcriptional regulator n=1 Tax=Streptomyces liliifuscus TaxID=2797636 RepID=A0A7T7RGA9_9ACTN|nr:metalloregulator ArsR/SmtB family transcription factor [Streptomyces liliifuscus]QQM45643.1 winged helix-turn-helix transcriptional regulator [Streptomyces liliifuscus]
MEAQVPSWDEEQAERSVAVLKAVADSSRYRLLWALSDRELPVSRLAELIGAHVAATSQHLAKLRAAGLVASRREGTRIYYRAAGRQVRALLECAVLVADPAESGSGGAGEAEAPAAVAQESPAGVRARHRPVAEH